MKTGRRLDRRDHKILFAAAIFYIVCIAVYTRFFSQTFGSTLDWSNQHFAIPDLLRKQFYETGELFPSFAPNIGAGENIYVLSYYGLYSPVIMLSYLLPFVSMAVYIQVSSAVLAYLGGALFYRFAKKHFSGKIPVLLLAGYLLAAPVFLHSHRHIMFVNYLPFLILALEACDSFFEGRGGTKLTFWCLMMILTSWFFSVSGLLAVTAYGIYRYLKTKGSFRLSDFAKAGAGFALRIITAVMLAGVLLLPTIYVLLSGRDDTNRVLETADLIPLPRFSGLGFSSYSMGLGCMALLGIVVAVAAKDKARRFLGIVIALLISVPLLTYILNGTMYIDYKVLIPFMPLTLLLCGELLEDIEADRLTKKHIIAALIVFALSYILSKRDAVNLVAVGGDMLVVCIAAGLMFKKGDKRGFTVAMVLVPFISSAAVNSTDEPMLFEDIRAADPEACRSLSRYIEDDPDLWRTALAENRHNSANIVTTPAHYSAYIYSSIHHKGYNDFYFNVMNNENEYRNSALTTRSQNPMFEIFMSNRYLYSESTEVPFGYEKVAEEDGITLFRTEYALPFGRCKPQLGEDVFDKLSNPEKMEALLKYTVVGTGGEFQGSVGEVSELRLPEHSAVTPTDSGYHIVSEEEFTIEHVPLGFTVPEGKLLVLELECDNTAPPREDVKLTVNGVGNKLTAPDWKYYNHNTTFTYVLPPQNGKALNELSMTFTAGDYLFSRLRICLMDYPYTAHETDALHIDKSVSRGERFTGSINCTEDSWFELCFPYDEGFTITVDGREQEYECVDKTFIGFELRKGQHTIDIRYKAPLLDRGKLLSAIGAVLFALLAAADIAARRLKKDQSLEKTGNNAG